jgi:lipopolysaccharide transport system ATP-binding protein
VSNIVIKAENLGKKYIIGHQAENGRYMALRDVLMQNARSFWYKTKDLVRGRPIIKGATQEEVWALKDVSFEIRRGEVVGIIGRNGAGKSTLLKVLSRITEPSAGRVTIKGRVASLLEVGTGFHPELTGWENIYLNGAILGMTRQEIKRKFDEIVAFAEVEKFLDTPVKRYSSGMYVRLAFAVAAHLEPEILLVDEVLAVGDAAFQKKCLGKMGNVAKEGRTVLFVSHNMRAITGLCQRTIWFDYGMIQHEGRPEVIVYEYLSSGLSASGWWRRPAHIQAANELKLLEAEVSQAGKSQVSIVSSNQPFDIGIKYEVRSRLHDCSVILRLTDMNGTVVFTSWDSDSNANLPQFREPGIYQSVCRVPAHLLRPGRYAVTIAAHIYRVRVLDFQESVLNFDISDVGYKFNKERLGIIHPILDWMVDKV